MVYMKSEVTGYCVKVASSTKVCRSSTHSIHPCSHHVPHGSEDSQAKSEDLKGISLVASLVLQTVK